MSHTVKIFHFLDNSKVLFEFEASDEQQASGLAMRAALETAVFSGADLHGADLRGANLRGADLHGADLGGADLDGANLGGADLRGADLDGANLHGANLRGANLRGADLHGAYLRGADLHGAYLDKNLKLIGERPVFGIGPIGSRCDYLTAYITDKGLMLRVGCFFGTEIEFCAKLKFEHGTNVHAHEYMAALELIKLHFDLWSPKALDPETEKQQAEY